MQLVETLPCAAVELVNVKWRLGVTTIVHADNFESCSLFGQRRRKRSLVLGSIMNHVECRLPAASYWVTWLDNPILKKVSIQHPLEVLGICYFLTSFFSIQMGLCPDEWSSRQKMGH